VNALKAGEIVSVKHGESKEEPSKPAPISDLLKIALWFSGAYVVFLFAGYLPMVLAFSIFFLKFRIGFSWMNSAIMTAIFGLATWAIFTLILGLEPFGMRYYY
jgi:hypothetical protein